MSTKSQATYEVRGFNTEQAAAYLGLSYSWLTKARINQTTVPGPDFIKIGTRAIYRREDLDAYLASPPA